MFIVSFFFFPENKNNGWQQQLFHNFPVVKSRLQAYNRGQKNIRAVLSVSTGDHVTFIVENDSVPIVNSAIYAIQKLQEQMKGQAALAGFGSEENIADWIPSHGGRKMPNEHHDSL